MSNHNDRQETQTFGVATPLTFGVELEFLVEVLPPSASGPDSAYNGKVCGIVDYSHPPTLDDLAGITEQSPQVQCIEHVAKTLKDDGISNGKSLKVTLS
jgi:hypothetical protein